MNIVPKYQKGNYIAQQDAIRNYKPKQPQEKYAIQTKQPTISQDNRSSWQKQQSQSKAQQGYKDYMESKQTQKGLHNLNGFLNFTDYVGLATGAGSLISSGVKYAGKKLVKRGVKPLVKERFTSVGALPENNKEFITLHSKMNMSDMEQINKAVDGAEDLYKLYLQNPTVANRINKVSPEYTEVVKEFVKPETRIPRQFGPPGNNWKASNGVADNAPIDTKGVPFRHQRNIFGIDSNNSGPSLDIVRHENSHGIDRAVDRNFGTGYLNRLIDSNDGLSFNNWAFLNRNNKAIIDYTKKRGWDITNSTNLEDIRKNVYNNFVHKTEGKAYFGEIPFNNYLKSVDRNYDGKIINNPVSEDIFKVTDKDILDSPKLQVISSIYNKRPNAYERFKRNLSNNIWGIPALGVPVINMLVNSNYE